MAVSDDATGALIHGAFALEVRQLIDGRWRVYYKNELLLETTPPLTQRPLRTSRRRYRAAQIGEKRRITNIDQGNDLRISRLTHDLGAGAP